MRSVRVFSNNGRAWTVHQCTFGEKNARFSISKFYVIQILYHVQMIIDIVEFASKF